MWYLMTGAVSMAIGLYAGKRRAIGMGWGEIGKEMSTGVFGVAKSAWSTISSPFRRGSGRPDEEV